MDIHTRTHTGMHTSRSWRDTWKKQSRASLSFLHFTHTTRLKRTSCPAWGNSRLWRWRANSDGSRRACWIGSRRWRQEGLVMTVLEEDFCWEQMMVLPVYVHTEECDFSHPFSSLFVFSYRSCVRKLLDTASICPKSSHWNPIPLSGGLHDSSDLYTISLLYDSLFYTTVLDRVKWSTRTMYSLHQRCLQEWKGYAQTCPLYLSLSLSLLSASSLMKITSYVVVIYNVLLHTVCYKYWVSFGTTIVATRLDP